MAFAERREDIEKYGKARETRLRTVFLTIFNISLTTFLLSVIKYGI
jgi:hypothetical protein